MPRSSVRERLLEAGHDMLFRRGFNATSVQDITEAAGVPKGSFYNYFDSKESLGAEAVTKYALDLAERAATVALRDATASPLARLRNHFALLGEDMMKSDFIGGCLLGNFSAELSNQSDLIRGRVKEAFDHWTAAVADVIEQGQASGEITKEFPSKILAGLLIDAWEGALLRAKAEKSAAPLTLFLNLSFSKLLT